MKKKKKTKPFRFRNWCCSQNHMFSKWKYVYCFCVVRRLVRAFYTESRNKIYAFMCVYLQDFVRNQMNNKKKKQNTIRHVNEMSGLPLDLIWMPNWSPLTVAMALVVFSVENCLSLELQDALVLVAEHYYWAMDYPEAVH